MPRARGKRKNSKKEAIGLAENVFSNFYKILHYLMVSDIFQKLLKSMFSRKFLREMRRILHHHHSCLFAFPAYVVSPFPVILLSLNPLFCPFPRLVLTPFWHMSKSWACYHARRKFERRGQIDTLLLLLRPRRAHIFLRGKRGGDEFLSLFPESQYSISLRPAWQLAGGGRGGRGRNG